MARHGSRGVSSTLGPGHLVTRQRTELLRGHTVHTALLFTTLLVALLATAGCNEGDRRGTYSTTPTPQTQTAPSPESAATTSTAVLVTPDADDLVVPTISEEELDTSMSSGYSSEPWVNVEGSSIIYLGNTNQAGYDTLLRLAKQGNTSELAITSPGGSVYWGIRIGEVVYENGWDVRVRALCLSSCANYIFPAGRIKVIEDGGIVGWHGSGRQDQFFAEREGISVRQEIVNTISGALEVGLDNLTQQEFNREVARFVAESETLIEMERAFYERIGVEADISVYGHFPQRWPAIEGSGGWTFTLEDMAKFGLDGIIYEGSDAYPSDRARALQGLVLIEADDR